MAQAIEEGCERVARMPGGFLLDTTVIVGLFAGDPAVRSGLDGAAEVFVPVIAAGELYFGAWKSARTRDNLARIDEFCAENVLLACDGGTARF